MNNNKGRNFICLYDVPNFITITHNETHFLHALTYGDIEYYDKKKLLIFLGRIE